MSTQICRGFTDEQWRELASRLAHNFEIANNHTHVADWECAITVFERRITERFFSCIETLEKFDPKKDVDVPRGAPADCSTLPTDESTVPGFAILGLCCLLLETLASFAETTPDESAAPSPPCPYPNGNCIRPEPSGGRRIRAFLQRSAFGDAFNEDRMAKKFVSGVRNGILHEAETRGWIIWRGEPKGRIVTVEDNRYVLNRGEFADALRQEFHRYVMDLRDPSNVALRERFLKKMNDIVKAV